MSLARIRSTLTFMNSPGVTFFLSVWAASIFSAKVNIVTSEIIYQPYPLYPLPLDKGKGNQLFERGFASL